MAILRNLVADERAELERLRAENAALLSGRRNRTVKYKVSQKGAVQIDGLRRFPITLYMQELQTILGMKNELEQFMVDHENQLSKKGE